MADNYLEYKMEEFRKKKFKPFRPVKPKRKPRPAAQAPEKETPEENN